MWQRKRYLIPNSNHEIIIPNKMFQSLKKHVQIGNMPENGGLLFAEIKLPKIIIRYISKPNESDKRHKYLFKPDQIKQQLTINLMFMKKLHYIGEWHTHPELNPSPTYCDIQSMKDTFIKSKHELNYFLQIIVGNDPINPYLWVGLHNDKTYTELKQI